MKITVNRIAKKSTYTIGKMFINGNYVCDTIEDAVRDTKIQGKTAIPAGTYQITMNIKSSKFSASKYKWATKYGSYLPRLIDVPNYDGVLIHVGNDENDTEGCILVGQNKEVGKVINSVITFTALMNNYFVPAKKSGENIEITIK